MPIRTCVVCRRRAEKRELLRWVVEKGNAIPDPRGSAPGRGAYVCRTEDCVETVGHRGRYRGLDFGPVRAAFRLAIPEDVRQNVRRESRRK